MLEIIEARREQLGYELWKQALLIGLSLSKNFPETAEKGSPELYSHKRKPRCKMPDNLLKIHLETLKRGG